MTDLVSVIVPVYNEAEGLDAFHFRLRRALDLIPGIDSEIVYIDDGSTDQSRAVLQCIQSGDPCVLIVQLSRNFGKESALSAGFDVATGDALIVIDADLQDPPELIGSMIQEWRNGFDVVNMRRKSREGESAFKKLTAHLFYRTINRLSDVPIPRDVGDFRLVSRRAADALRSMPERCRFMKGLYAGSSTFRVEFLPKLSHHSA